MVLRLEQNRQCRHGVAEETRKCCWGDDTSIQYSISWCPKEREWVAMSPQFPSCSFFHIDPQQALVGMVAIANQYDVDQALAGVRLVDMEVKESKRVISKTTTLRDYYATGDYEAFCFDKHDGPESHGEAVEDIPYTTRNKCRVYPEELFPDNCPRFGTYTVTISYKGK